MAPNIFLAAKKLTTPHKWFRRSTSEKFENEFYAKHPVPGRYALDPMYGLVLLAKDSDHGVPLPQPICVKKSEVTKKHYLINDYIARTQFAIITNSKGKRVKCLMFRLDDGISWVACEDELGNKIKGPWPRYCVDKSTNEFKLMLKGDSPAYRMRVAFSNQEYALQAIRTNQEPAPYLPPIDSAAPSPYISTEDSRRSKSYASTGTPNLTPGCDTIHSLDTTGPSTPGTPGSAFMLPGPSMTGFNTSELDQKLVQLRLRG